MKRLFVLLLLVFPALASAQELHTFSNGEVADADDINSNFSLLDERLEAIEYAPGQETSTDSLTKGWAVYYAGCTENEWSLMNQWSDIEKEPRVIVKIEGTCEVDAIGRITPVNGQALYLDGRDNEGNCNNAGLKTSQPALLSSSGNQSSLTLHCLTLPSLAPMEFRLYGQGSLTLLWVSSPAYTNVTLRSSYFYNNSTAINSLYAEGSTIDFFNTLDITYLSLLSGSVFLSRDVGKHLEKGADQISDMKIESITLKSNSSAVITRPRVEVLIDNIDAEGRSYFEVSECKEEFQVKVREDSYRVSSVGYVHRAGEC